MKQRSLFLFPVLLAAGILFSCKNDTPGSGAAANSVPKVDTIQFEPASAEGAVPFAVTGGTVYWTAQRAIGTSHNGTIALSGGELLVNSGQVTGGQVIMDMTSLEVTNMDDRGEKATLESHLKDKDFFEVKKYPEARFEIMEILPSTQPAFNWVIRGKLTIKDKSNPVNVPVRMSIANDKLIAESTNFIINRTKWGINFRSGILGTAKDKVIQDVVPISLKIEAVRKRGE